MQLVDVREPEEYAGPLGHIAGARLVPLGELKARWKISTVTGQLSPCAVPVAARRRRPWLLQRAGFSKVANLGGGMLRWHAQGLPVAGP